MKCTTCDRWLHDYVDGHLAADDLRAYEGHLSNCASGRNDLESLRRLRSAARQLPRSIAPERDLWGGIEDGISSRVNATTPHFQPGPNASPRDIENPPSKSLRVLNWLAPIGMAAAIALLATLAERRIVPRDPAGWSVAALSGVPRVASRDVRNETRMRIGEWLVTDDQARAKVVVGAIGEVSLEPNSRLRLIGMAETNHRLELARGTLSAMIWAPPRLFFVNTPSATAVDLGCAYTLTVDDDGNGELHVSTGFVALEDRGRESIIRTGMMCLTRRGIGPGTPFAVDAPAGLRAALARFDFERSAGDSALREVLAQARPEDSITLWHLLDRTEGPGRAAVFDLLAQHAAPPAGVTRDGILRGDASMRKTWGSDLGIDRF